MGPIRCPGSPIWPRRPRPSSHGAVRATRAAVTSGVKGLMAGVLEASRRIELLYTDLQSAA